jgi:hypothetical protein
MSTAPPLPTICEAASPWERLAQECFQEGLKQGLGLQLIEAAIHECIKDMKKPGPCILVKWNLVLAELWTEEDLQKKTISGNLMARGIAENELMPVLQNFYSKAGERTMEFVSLLTNNLNKAVEVFGRSIAKKRFRITDADSTKKVGSHVLVYRVSQGA